jgi:hypothetical protein
VSGDVSAVGTVGGTVTFRFYAYGNSGTDYPLQRGFRGSSGGGTDLKVFGVIY